MGVGVGQDLTGQREPVLGHEHVGDAVLADRKVILDAETIDKVPQALGVVGRLHGRRRHDVVVHENEFLGVGDLQDVGSSVVELNRDVDIDHHDVAGAYHGLFGMPGQDLLYRVHGHRISLFVGWVTSG